MREHTQAQENWYLILILKWCTIVTLKFICNTKPLQIIHWTLQLTIMKLLFATVTKFVCPFRILCRYWNTSYYSYTFSLYIYSCILCIYINVLLIIITGQGVVPLAWCGRVKSRKTTRACLLLKHWPITVTPVYGASEVVLMSVQESITKPLGLVTALQKK